MYRCSAASVSAYPIWRLVMRCFLPVFATYIKQYQLFGPDLFLARKRASQKEIRTKQLILLDIGCENRKETAHYKTPYRICRHACSGAPVHMFPLCSGQAATRRVRSGGDHEADLGPQCPPKQFLGAGHEAGEICFGSRCRRRAKARTRWIKPTPRSADWRAALIQGAAVKASPSRVLASSRLPIMAVNRLLKSWAMPPVRPPTA